MESATNSPPPQHWLKQYSAFRTQYSKRTQFKKAYLSEDRSHMSVNDMWVKFKTGFVEAVERLIPSKMTILCAIDRCNDQKACKKINISFIFVLVNPRTRMSRFITSGSEHMYRRY